MKEREREKNSRERSIRRKKKKDWKRKVFGGGIGTCFKGTKKVLTLPSLYFLSLFLQYILSFSSILLLSFSSFFFFS